MILKGKIALVTFRFLWNCEFILSFCAVLTICISEDEIDLSFEEAKTDCTACSRGLWVKFVPAKAVFLHLALHFGMRVDVYKQDSWISQGLCKILSNRR